MPDFTDQILAYVARANYQPVKPKALARKIGVSEVDYPDFRRNLRDLMRKGRLEYGKNHTIRPLQPHGCVTGIFRKTSAGHGFVRPHMVEGKSGPEILIREGDSLDAATGDEVLVRLLKQPRRTDATATGKVLEVLERATRQFVGTYFEREGEGLVRVDGTVFSHSITVGDAGAKGARPDDKVVLEMIRFPTLEDRGEGVIVEVLGPRGQPGVDTLSVIRAFGLPDVFPEDVLEEARQTALRFREDDLEGREDLTQELIITIDPVDARDFDDAISLSRDEETGHWELGVHIADVSHFAPLGGALDREARRRGTSVYLPQRVLPMFPEVVSNGLASLQEGRVRYTKSVFVAFTPEGQKTEVRFANSAIRNKKRFTYEQVTALLDAADAGGERSPLPDTVSPDILALLLRMRELAMILRKRRRKRGALELTMPEVELEYDDEGRLTGGHFATHDVSHEIIEEFMLTANESVAEHLHSLGVAFLRRVHPDPEPTKLETFATFARSLGYRIDHETDRFALQRILEKSAKQPDVHAVHYALLRSLKQAIYSPQEEGHYALASDHYCHFTSPIRRYPDLVVHRLLQQWLERRRVGSDPLELATIGEHCSKTERRADIAERELVKLKLLTYMSDRIGTELEAIITGVADYGFFAQAENLPVEGLVHISTLPDDYYYFEPDTHSLIGRRAGRRYRLGDRVRVEVVRVDLTRRQMDFRVVERTRRKKEQ
jgi:ribonuclease R